MLNLEVKSLRLQYRNTLKRRRVKISLNNGSVIYIIACHESYEQYGGNMNELRFTQPIADKYNGWLHGEKIPDVEMEFMEKFMRTN